MDLDGTLHGCHESWENRITASNRDSASKPCPTPRIAPPSMRFLPSLVLALSPSFLAAQQFTSGGPLPGGAVWTEGVEAADVDLDGDLDLFFANGEGTALPGTERANQLIVNRLEIAPFDFADESAARLGTATSHSRDVAAGDVDGDGWIDAVFAVAFETDAPFLYMNRGAAQPGFFDSEGAARGLVEALSSTAAQFGDVDGDGDLDLLINDAGADLLGGSGGSCRLYRNDGAGVFTEVGSASFPAPVQVAPMELQFTDLDLDWDLDVVATARGGGHALLLNDGAGHFTDASGLIPATSSSVYEVEAADLDSDGDADLFFLGSQANNDGGMENEFVPSGVLSFTKQAAVSFDTDRAVAWFDYDLDRDYDAIVASPSTEEKVLENRPSGVEFQEDVGVIAAVTDTTLDLTVADLDNDGAADIVTAQGESGAFDNRYYVNTGIPDPLQPLVIRQEELPRFSNVDGPWLVRAETRDQIRDDGRTWIQSDVSYVTLDNPVVVDVTMSGLNFVPKNISVSAGTTVRWTNTTSMGHTVTSYEDELPFNSGFMLSSDVFEYTFVSPGVFDYFCIPHESLNMVGSVTVTGSAQSGPGREIGGGLHGFAIDDQGPSRRYVAYELGFTDWAQNRVVAPGRVAEICGWRRYGTGAGGANVMDLFGEGGTEIGGTFVATTEGSAGALTGTFIALGQSSVPFLGGTFLLDPTKLVDPLLVEAVVDGRSSNVLPIPNDGSLVGATVYLQSLTLDGSQTLGWAFSNGLAFELCL